MESALERVVLIAGERQNKAQTWMFWACVLHEDGQMFFFWLEWHFEMAEKDCSCLC